MKRVLLFVAILFLAIVSRSQEFQLSSVQEILDDMLLPHEAIPSGVPTYYDWYGNPRIHLGNSPGSFKYLMAWGHAYVRDDYNGPTCTFRLQIKNIKAYYLSKRDLKWYLIQSSEKVTGSDFIESYVQNKHKSSDMRTEKENSVSVRLDKGYNFHFWVPGKKVRIFGDDIKAILTMVEAKLIGYDDVISNEADGCPIVLGMGGDYWIDEYSSWGGVGVNNDDVGIGRLKCVGTEWRSFYMTTLTEDDAHLFPPPVN